MTGLRIRWNDHRQNWEVVERFVPIASFSKCHEAEAFVIAESKRRESVA